VKIDASQKPSICGLIDFDNLAISKRLHGFVSISGMLEYLFGCGRGIGRRATSFDRRCGLRLPRSIGDGFLL
jgi:hypothetical protein